MEESLINQDQELVWYENDRLIQEYLNRSRQIKTKEEDRQVDQSSWLKMLKIPEAKPDRKPLSG
jgi:hypothetical protein